MQPVVSASGLHLHRLPHAQSGVGRGLPRVSVTLSPLWGRGLLLRRGGALSSTPGFRLHPPSGCDNQKCLQIWPHVPWGHDCPSLGTTAAEKELRLRKSTWYMGGGGGERGASAKPDLETPPRGAPEASQLSLASALDSLLLLVRFPTSLRPSAFFRRKAWMLTTCAVPSSRRLTQDEPSKECGPRSCCPEVLGRASLGPSLPAAAHANKPLSVPVPAWVPRHGAPFCQPLPVINSFLPIETQLKFYLSAQSTRVTPLHVLKCLCLYLSS